MRIFKSILALALIAGALRCWPQQKPDLNTYFRDYIGLNESQIKAIHNGRAVAKNLHSRTSAEIFVFGAVYINATPDGYIKLSTDFDRLRDLPGYVAIRRFSTPPKMSDLDGFTFEKDDIDSLQECKPGNCQVQMPEISMQKLRQSVEWSAPNVAEQVNRLLQQRAFERLNAYRREGNAALGTYDDKQHATDVAKQIHYILSYSRALPEYLPGLYKYLLDYPRQRPGSVDDSFYWAKVKFGLKPTLRIVHVITLRGDTGDELAYAVAEKQLYASHYFQTALDLTFCIRNRSDPDQNGFYLVKIMGSEQAGLTGFKGSFVRKAAVDRSASSLQKSLAAIKNELERGR